MGSIKKKILIIIFIIFEIIFIINNSILAIIIYTRPKMEYKRYDMIDYVKVLNIINDECDSIVYNKMTKQEIKQEIEKIIPLKYFIYIEKEKMGLMWGQTIFLTRTIKIKKDLVPSDYAVTLIHEYYHLYYLNPNERITQYNTFLLLYESDINFLKRAALILANHILTGRYEEDYDCTAQIIEYFNNKEATI